MVVEATALVLETGLTSRIDLQKVPFGAWGSQFSNTKTKLDHLERLVVAGSTEIIRVPLTMQSIFIYRWENSFKFLGFYE